MVVIATEINYRNLTKELAFFSIFAKVWSSVNESIHNNIEPLL